MSEKKNTGKRAVIAVIVIALIVAIIALAVVISGKSKKGGSKSATESGTEAGSETMRSGQFDIDYAKQVTKLADYSGVAITVSNDYEINDTAKQTYLTNVLQSYGADAYKQVTDRDTVQAGDIVNTDYSKTVDEVMGMIDVSPTLENMFGLYNQYALGHDMFSIDENVVVFPSGNWMTNKLYYNSSKKSYRQLEQDASISMDYIDKYNEYAETIIELSNGIINYDLINRVNEDDEQLK